MKKHLLIALMAAGALAASAASAPTWTACTTNADLDPDAEYLIVYVNPNGVYSAQCDIMSYDLIGSNRGFEVTQGASLIDNVIYNAPANSAIVKLEASGSNYALKLTNGPLTGYLSPLEGERNGIRVVDTPVPASISIAPGKPNETGVVTAAFNTTINFREGQRTSFSWVNTPVNGAMHRVFWSCAQGETDGSLGLYKKTEIPAALEWTAAPASGSVQESVTEFTLTFPNAKSIVPGNATEGVQATLDGVKIDAPAVQTSGNTAKCTFSKAIASQGKLSVSIPAGYFSLIQEEGDAIASIPLTYELQLSGMSPEQAFTLSPEPGAYDQYPAVTVTYTGASAITPSVRESIDASIVISGPDGESAEPVACTISAEGNTVTFTPLTAIDQYTGKATTYTLTVSPGAYSITYPEGTFANTALSITSYSVASPVKTVTVTPAPGTYNTLNVIRDLNFAIESSFPVTTLAPGKTISLTMTPAGGEARAIGTYEATSLEAGVLKASMRLSVKEEDAVSGTYKVTIPSGMLLLNRNGRILPDPDSYEFEYTLDINSGIDAVFTGSEILEVYDASGIRVISAGSPEDFESLPAGLYIVNGHKIIKK